MRARRRAASRWRRAELRAVALAGVTCAVACGGDDAPPLVPEATRVEAVDLGSFPVDDKGYTEELTVTIVPDALSLTLVATAPKARQVLYRIIGPDGSLLTSDRDGCSSVTSPNPVYPQAGSSVALIPGDDGDLHPGTYRIRLRSTATSIACDPPLPGPGPVALRAIWKLGSPGGGQVLTAQRLHLNIFLVGDVQPTAILDKSIRALGDVLERAGLLMDEPSFFSIGGADGERFASVSVIDPDETEMRALFTRSAAASVDGPSLFVVDAIGADRWGILGLAAGIPGTPERGSERAGVLVDSTVLNGEVDDPRFAGHVFAHELGHLLGLYHSSSAFGFGDPIADTPTCPIWMDANHDGWLDRSECLGRDGNNLMFWQGHSFGDRETARAGTLTPGQARVLLRSPSVTGP